MLAHVLTEVHHVHRVLYRRKWRGHVVLRQLIERSLEKARGWFTLTLINFQTAAWAELSLTFGMFCTSSSRCSVNLFFLCILGFALVFFIFRRSFCLANLHFRLETCCSSMFRNRDFFCVFIGRTQSLLCSIALRFTFIGCTESLLCSLLCSTALSHC